MLLNTIWSYNEEDSSGFFTETIQNLFGIDDFLLIRPGMLWVNGKTFIAGEESNFFSKNRIKLFQYDHSIKNFIYVNVGDGTNTFDSYNHPRAWIWIEGGYIYTGQTNTHNAPITLYKSNFQNRISGGFTQLTTVPGDNAYPQAFQAIDGTFCFSVRKYALGGEDHNVAFNKSDAGIEGTFTLTQITANDSGTSLFWFYNQFPIMYGTNTKQFFIGSLRNTYPTTQSYFANAVYITEDFQNFTNYNGTFSKDISVARITNTETEDHFTINGTQLDDSQDLGIGSAVQINDVLYFIAIKEGTTNDFHIFKCDGTTVESVFVNIPNITKGNGLHMVYLFYNGVNLVLSCIIDDGVTRTMELWAIPLDLTTFTQKFVYESPVTNGPISLPENLNMVTGEFLIFIKALTGSTALFYRGNDKFYV